MVSAAKKPEPDIVVRLVGPGVRPWGVPMRTLTKALNAVQRLIDERDEETEEDTESKPKVQSDPRRTLHLVNIKSGSAAYAVSAPNRDLAFSILSLVGQSIGAPNVADWADSTLSSLKKLSEVARSLGCEIELRKSGTKGRQGDVLAKITPRTYADIALSAFIRGRTSIYAKIERVGGATAWHCGIRIAESPRKMVICRVVSDDLIRGLGQYMYQYVLLTGRGIWLRHSGRLRRLVIESFERPKTGSILAALKNAHDAGGHVWDSIEDPDAFIAEMREQ